MALDRLGADYRIKTSLYAKSKPTANGTLKGDLIVFGRGDPLIQERRPGMDIYQTLDPLVFALTNAGVKKIKGDLVADTSYFRGPEFGSGWVWDDLENSYGAEISALTVNNNTLAIKVQPGARVGSPCQLSVTPAAAYLSFYNRTETAGTNRARTITFYRPPGHNYVFVFGQMSIDDPGYTEDVPFHRPAGLFVSLFKQALARHKIEVTGRLRTIDWLESRTNSFDCTRMIELGFVESAPMSVLARAIQKPSQNLYADLLFAHVGETMRDDSTDPDTTSEELGVRALRQFLTHAGIEGSETIFEEGSGLSRDNLTTPNATVTLLKFMSQHKCAEAFVDALPIAGVDGTLRNRMKGTAAEGKVRAKTGSLRWAKSLAGYVTTAAGERLVFCFMLNRFQSVNGSPSADLDAMAVVLAGFTGRSADR
jgi:D-alanyl-D-alanine carboxypeptidase/D-alanyl-D-alanine-endopeptidase (penicillin-binding protein 4)